MTEDVKKLIDYYKGRDDVSALYLFGGWDDLGPGKGVGVGVLMSKRQKQTRPSHGPLAGSVEVVYLNRAPLFLRHHVLRKGSLVFERDARHRMDFAHSTINEYLDDPLIFGMADAEGIAFMQSGVAAPKPPVEDAS